MKKYKIEKFYGGWFLYKRIWWCPFLWKTIDVYFSWQECITKIGELESFVEIVEYNETNNNQDIQI